MRHVAHGHVFWLVVSLAVLGRGFLEMRENSHDSFGAGFSIVGFLLSLWRGSGDDSGGGWWGALRGVGRGWCWGWLTWCRVREVVTLMGTRGKEIRQIDTWPTWRRAKSWSMYSGAHPCRAQCWGLQTRCTLGCSGRRTSQPEPRLALIFECRKAFCHLLCYVPQGKFKSFKS